MRRHLLVLLTAVALLATACGDDGGSATVDGGGPPAAGGAGAATGEASSDDSDNAADDSPPDPVELTASHRGVTADTIKIGVAAIDLERLKSFGIDIDGLEAEIWAPAWAAAFNERGGAHGRMMETVVSTFLPVGSTESDLTCVQLTQDEEVFVVLGSMLGDNPLCVTQVNNTTYVGMFGLTAQRQERSVAPFFASEMAADLQRTNALTALIGQGTFDGVKLGLYWEEADEFLATDIVLPLLEQANINVVQTVAQLDYGDDQVAAAASADTLFAALAGAGADMYLNISGIVTFNRAMDRSRPGVPFVLLNGQVTNAAVVSTSGYAPEILADAIAVTASKLSAEEWLVDAGWQQCVQEVNDSGLDDLVPEELDATVIEGIGQACQAFRLLEHLLVNASPVLTPDALIAVADATGEISLPGMAAGSLGPGKYSVGDAVRYYTYDPDKEIMIPDGDPIVVGG